MLIAESRSLELLIAARVIQGIGSAASWISALAVVSDTAPPGRRGESIGAALAATGFGSIGLGDRAPLRRLDRGGAGFALAFSAAVPWLDEAFEEHERGLGYGVQNLLYAGGYAIGPVLGGWLLELSGADFAYLVTAGAIAVGTLLLVLRRPAV